MTTGPACETRSARATLPANERELLEAARQGDEDAYGRLVGPYRAELDAHCYRMLGSAADAEDALQETLLRAWRALPRFEGRSSLRSWLYKIATNACLRAIERRPKRVLPIDYAPAADPHDGPPEPATEAVRLPPYPPAGVDAVVAMLAEDARMAMPPLPTWYRGRDQVGMFLRGWPLASRNRWRLIPARANGQLAFGAYTWDQETQTFMPHDIIVLTLRGTQIEEITAFLTSDAFHRFNLPDAIPANS